MVESTKATKSELQSSLADVNPEMVPQTDDTDFYYNKDFVNKCKNPIYISLS